MNHYIYTDNATLKIVFECDAVSIMEADKLFEGSLGVSAVKSPKIGCQIFFEKVVDNFKVV